MSRASFSTLPLELKARIVEMTSDQEDALKLRQDLKDRAGHINSLSSLALVNKELRALAAKHQFKVLPSGRVTQSIFRFRILPRYAHHITEIWFSDQHSKEEAEQALTIAGLLPALRALRLGGQTATSLFGPGVTLRNDLEDEEASHRSSIITSLAPRIEFLLLYNFKPSEAIGLVAALRNLKTLAFFNLKDDTDSAVAELVREVTSLAALDALSIDLDSSTVGWLFDALAPVADNPPPVRRLQLVYFPFRDGVFRFVSYFSTTIENLTLELRRPEAIAIPAIHLPRLTSLNLTVQEFEQLEEVSRILLPRDNNPSLFSLNIHIPHTGVINPEDPSLLRVLDSQPALRSLELGSNRRCYPIDAIDPEELLASPSSLAAYADLVHSRGLDPSVLDRPHLTPFHPVARLDYTENEEKILTGTLRRTLEFGLIELDRMAAEGRETSAVEWVPILKPLEDKRLAWKD